MSKSLTSIAFNNLKPEEREFLRVNYPDLYKDLYKQWNKEYVFKYYENLKQYSKQCKIDNLKNLTKKELIKCLIRKYPVFHDIKREGGIHFKQFIYLFFRCIIQGYKTYDFKNARTTTPIILGPIGPVGEGPPLNETPNERDNERRTSGWNSYPHLGNVVKCTGTVKQTPRDRNSYPDGPTLPYFTVNQFTKFINILYPTLQNKWPLVYQDYIDTARMMPNSVMGPNNVLGKLVTIGHFYILEAFRTGWQANFTQLEANIYRRNFMFSYEQVMEVLNVITREQYLKILVNPEINLEELAVREPNRRRERGIVPLY